MFSSFSGKRFSSQVGFYSLAFTYLFISFRMSAMIIVITIMIAPLASDVSSWAEELCHAIFRDVCVCTRAREHVATTNERFVVPAEHATSFAPRRVVDIS